MSDPADLFTKNPFNFATKVADTPSYQPVPIPLLARGCHLQPMPATLGHVDEDIWPLVLGFGPA
eukprot:6363154-Heterocapsa_arctica.AAC.1